MKLWPPYLGFLILLFTLVFLPLSAQQTVTPNSSTTIFESLIREEVLQLRLQTNLRQLIRHRSAKAYQPAKLTYQKESGDEVSWEVKIKSRGNARLQVCSLPPLFLRFAKEGLKDEGLQGKRKFKLVLSCESNDLHEQLVLREYLVYKLFNVLTEQSFRVQLVYLQLEDSGNKEKTRETYAFVIEHEDEMATRLNGKIFSPRAYRRSALMETPFDLMSLFQYMVGNTDWFVSNLHNLKLVQMSDPDQVLAVPYDFDYAGIVDAPYALPQRDLPISSVVRRYFIGACRETGQFDPTIQFILSKKAELLAEIEDCVYLKKQSKNWMLKFLNKSFEILEDPQQVTEEIAKGCGWKP